MPIDTTFRLSKAYQTVKYDYTGKSGQFMRYIFFLGEHGPFTEDVPMEPTFNDQAIKARVTQLQQHLAAQGY